MATSTNPQEKDAAAALKAQEDAAAAAEKAKTDAAQAKADEKVVAADEKAAEAASDRRKEAIAKAEREAPGFVHVFAEAEQEGVAETREDYLHFGGLSKAEAEAQYYPTDIGHL